jgi:uncharacterized protein YrrD
MVTMSERRDVVPVNALIGRSVLSLSTGNELGKVADVFVDPVNGLMVGLTLTSIDASESGLSYDRIHSFGHDAIMALADDSLEPAESEPFPDKPNARELIGTKIITDSGNLLGQIAEIYVTVTAPPLVIYEIRDSVFDKLFGRQLFIPASAGYALSDDRKRLIVPNETSELAASGIEELLDVGISVRSISEPGAVRSGHYDDTVVVPPFEDENTVVREYDDDETLVRSRDDDETVLRLRRRGTS